MGRIFCNDTFFADYSKKGYVYLTYSSVLFTTYSASAGMNEVVLTSLVSGQQNENKKNYVLLGIFKICAF